MSEKYGWTDGTSCFFYVDYHTCYRGKVSPGQYCVCVFDYYVRVCVCVFDYYISLLHIIRVHIQFFQESALWKTQHCEMKTSNSHQSASCRAHEGRAMAAFPHEKCRWLLRNFYSL